MQRLDAAVEGLEEALAVSPEATPSWRGIVRQRLGSLVEELTAESTTPGEHAGTVDDGWLSARAGTLHRERDRLLTRLGALSAMVSGPAEESSFDSEHVRRTLLRVVHDVHRHHARVNDLCYDAVALDMGGSE